MDDRVLQVKAMKKAYKKERRRAVWFWDLCWYVLLTLLAAAVCLLAYVIFYKAPVIRFIDLQLWTPVKNLLGITGSLRMVGSFVYRFGHLFVSGFLALLLPVVILRGRAVARTRRFDSYLDYMTMKTTLKTEKMEEKL